VTEGATEETKLKLDADVVRCTDTVISNPAKLTVTCSTGSPPEGLDCINHGEGTEPAADAEEDQDPPQQLLELLPKKPAATQNQNAGTDCCPEPNHRSSHTTSSSQLPTQQ